MNQIDKNILSVLYSSRLLGVSPIVMFGTDKYHSQETQNSLKKLHAMKMINEMRLTEIGRDAIKVVLVGGVFDIIHPGHVYALKSAKALGDVLVVVVATNNTIQKMKGSFPNHNEKERQNLVSFLKPVDACVIGEKNIFNTVLKIKPNIVALGYDQIHKESYIKKGCLNVGVNADIVRLASPIPKISSREIQKNNDIVYDL